MKLHRIWAVILRFLYNFRHNFDRVVDVFYWPAMDLILWGVTSAYFSSFSPEASRATLLIVSSIVFWLLAYRAQYEIAGNLLEDLWNRNLVNIFVAPLKFSEWLSTFVILGVLKGALSFAFALGLAYFLYQVKIFAFGFYLLPFAAVLILMGWWLGFAVAALILRFGTRVQAFAWTAIWAVAPFSAIYYPVSALPGWAQTIAHFMPASYVFEGMREVLNKGVFNWNDMWIGLGLNLVYLILSVWFIKSSFEAVKRRGMVKLY